MVLLSGRALAEASGRVFEMAWSLDATCYCAFDQLFEQDCNVRLIREFDPQQWRDLRRVPPTKFPDLLRAQGHTLRLRYHHWLIQPQRCVEHVPLERRAQALWNDMQPIPPIAARIESFQQKFFRPIMIGVHLWRGDYYRARPDCVANLDAALYAVDNDLAVAPDAGILLCTDDGATDPFTQSASVYHGVREQFVQRYGTRVVSTTPRSLDRAAPQAIQDALVDLELLRRTQFFVGTADSSFSALAVFGRDIPTTMTAGATAAFQQRQRWYKRTGIYYLVHALGRLEFGAGNSQAFVVGMYQQRVHALRHWVLTIANPFHLK